MDNALSIANFDVLNYPELATQPRKSNWLETGVNSAIDIIDRVTKAPAAIRESTYRFEDAFIEAGQNLQGGASQAAERNLRSGKIDSMFQSLSNWFQTGNNVWWAIGGVILFLIIYRK